MQFTYHSVHCFDKQTNFLFGWLDFASNVHISNTKTKMTEETDFPKEINELNKNKNTIRCQFCDSIILKAMTANYSENEVSRINK